MRAPAELLPTAAPGQPPSLQGAGRPQSPWTHLDGRLNRYPGRQHEVGVQRLGPHAEVHASPGVAGPHVLAPARQAGQSHGPCGRGRTGTDTVTGVSDWPPTGPAEGGARTAAKASGRPAACRALRGSRAAPQARKRPVSSGTGSGVSTGATVRSWRPPADSGWGERRTLFTGDLDPNRN